ncbi:hypothetical protein LOD99_6206 [Oopsacas minuta]|uniref:Uncharacterized protein n=1 Tax=Oopsacas minuta TaxID=111878 RepID=A0AAV7JNS8_9METZ|nr:hypothetical protein LOD99_6206 [Oopsacas minuta]
MDYVNTPTQGSYYSFTRARDRVTKLSLNLRRNSEKKLSQNLNTPLNIKKFFLYAKQQMIDSNHDISLFDSFGELTSESQSANMFSKHFSSVFNSPIEIELSKLLYYIS